MYSSWVLVNLNDESYVAYFLGRLWDLLLTLLWSWCILFGIHASHVMSVELHDRDVIETVRWTTMNGLPECLLSLAQVNWPSSQRSVVSRKTVTADFDNFLFWVSQGVFSAGDSLNSGFGSSYSRSWSWCTNLHDFLSSHRTTKAKEKKVRQQDGVDSNGERVIPVCKWVLYVYSQFHIFVPIC
jgi:hypothetical protein